MKIKVDRYQVNVAVTHYPVNTARLMKYSNIPANSITLPQGYDLITWTALIQVCPDETHRTAAVWNCLFKYNFFQHGTIYKSVNYELHQLTLMQMKNRFLHERWIIWHNSNNLHCLWLQPLQLDISGGKIKTVCKNVRRVHWLTVFLLWPGAPFTKMV